MWKQGKQWETLFLGAPKSLQKVTAAMKLKDTCSLEEKLWPTSVQFSRSVMSNSLQPHERQHTRLPCSSLSFELKLLSTESVMPSNHLILCHPLFLLPPIFPSIRVFSNESALCFRWTTYWSFSFKISPTNEQPELISFRMDWLHLLALSRVFSNTTVQRHQFFSTQLSSQSNSHIHTWPLEKL